MRDNKENHSIKICHILLLLKIATGGKNGIDPYLFPQEICGYVIVSYMTYLSLHIMH